MSDKSWYYEQQLDLIRVWFFRFTTFERKRIYVTVSGFLDWVKKEKYNIKAVFDAKKTKEFIQNNKNAEFQNVWKDVPMNEDTVNSTYEMNSHLPNPRQLKHVNTSENESMSKSLKWMNECLSADLVDIFNLHIMVIPFNIQTKHWGLCIITNLHKLSDIEFLKSNTINQLKVYIFDSQKGRNNINGNLKDSHENIDSILQVIKFKAKNELYSKMPNNFVDKTFNKLDIFFLEQQFDDYNCGLFVVANYKNLILTYNKLTEKLTNPNPSQINRIVQKGMHHFVNWVRTEVPKIRNEMKLFVNILISERKKSLDYFLEDWKNQSKLERRAETEVSTPSGKFSLDVPSTHTNHNIQPSKKRRMSMLELESNTTTVDNVCGNTDDFTSLFETFTLSCKDESEVTCTSCPSKNVAEHTFQIGQEIDILECNIHNTGSHVKINLFRATLKNTWKEKNDLDKPDLLCVQRLDKMLNDVLVRISNEKLHVVFFKHSNIKKQTFYSSIISTYPTAKETKFFLNPASEKLTKQVRRYTEQSFVSAKGAHNWRVLQNLEKSMTDMNKWKDDITSKTQQFEKKVAVARQRSYNYKLTMDLVNGCSIESACNNAHPKKNCNRYSPNRPKPLILFDLNGVLCFKEIISINGQRRNWYRVRNDLSKIFDTIKDVFAIGIYSSKIKANVDFIKKQIGRDHGRSNLNLIKYTYNQSNCELRKNCHFDYNKNIVRIVSDLKDYNYDNVIMIDDSPEKFENCKDNVIIFKSIKSDEDVDNMGKHHLEFFKDIVNIYKANSTNDLDARLVLKNMFLKNKTHYSGKIHALSEPTQNQQSKSHGIYQSGYEKHQFIT